MALQDRFGQALQLARKSRDLTQEDFSDVSSRTYLSTLERGLKSPTLEKIQQLSAVLGMHPVSLLALAYMLDKKGNLESLFDKIRNDVSSTMESR